MGLRLPQRRGGKLLYILLEVSLLLVTSLMGGLRLIGLWFVILMIRNCQFLARCNRLGVTMVAFGVLVALQIQRRQILDDSLLQWISSVNLERLVLAWILAYGFLLVFLQLLIDTLLSEYRNRQRLSKANLQIRQYAAQIEEMATAQERNRIAQEIHDALGHSLTALNVHLEAVTKLWQIDPVEANLLLSEAQQLARVALTDVRQSVSSLRSDPLTGLSLKDAIATLLKDVERTGQIQIQTDLSLDFPLSTELKTAIYRILQEALTNIIKHASATIVQLEIQAQGQLQVTLQDNGIGFDQNQNTTGFGLHSMLERTLAQGGKFGLVTAPGQGCQITLSFPLDNR